MPPEVWAADEQELLLLLEPEEFLQGVFQLTQVLGEGLGSQPGCAVVPLLIKDGGAGEGVQWAGAPLCLTAKMWMRWGKPAGLLAWEQMGATAASRGLKQGYRGPSGELNQKPEVGNW